MTTINLSAIPGVVTYATRAAALSAAVDSGAAFNAWMLTQTPTPANPLTIVWDGWIYVAGSLVYCPTVAGNVAHVLKAGLTPAAAPGGARGTTDAGAVFGVSNNARPRLLNGYIGAMPPTSTGGVPVGNVKWTTQSEAQIYAAITNANISFTGLTFDFNVIGDSPAQPHEDNSWGWAMGFAAICVRNLTLDTCTLLNPRTFTFHCIGLDGLTALNTVIDAGVHNAENFDGWHINGPFRNIAIIGGSVKSFDDAIAISSGEPIAATSGWAFLQAPWIGSEWNGGNVSNVLVKNVRLDAAWGGVRLMGIPKSTAPADAETNVLDGIVIDGLTGTTDTYTIQLNNFYVDHDTNASVSVKYGAAHCKNLTIRNLSVNRGTGGNHPYMLPAQIRIRARVDNLNIDVASCSAMNNETNYPFVNIDSDSVIGALDWGFTKAPTPLFSDNFGGGSADTTAVPYNANGWNDFSGSHIVTGGKLTGTFADGSRLNEIRRAESAKDVSFSLDYTEALPTGGNIVALVLRSDNTNWYTFNLGNSGALQTFRIPVGVIAGSNVPFHNQSDALRMKAHCFGSKQLFVVQRLVQGQATPPPDTYTGLTTYATLSGDSSLPVPGKILLQSVAANVPNNKVAITNAASYLLTSSAPTQFAVLSSPPDANGVIQCTVGSVLPAGANALGGAWTTTAGAIDPFGRLSGLPLGQTAQVTYTLGGVYALASVSAAPPVAVSSVAITSPVPPALAGGGTLQLAALVFPAGANQSVTWAATVYNAGGTTAPGTISAGGLLTLPALANVGKRVVVTATATDGKTTATVSIYVSPATVDSVTVFAPFAADGGTQVQLAATVNGANAPGTGVTWGATLAGADGTAGAAQTISAAGLLTLPATAAANQTVTVTATSVMDTTKSGTATILVPATGDSLKAGDLNAQYAISKSLRGAVRS